MAPFSRTDNSIIAQWWWTVDKWMLGAIFAIIAIGIILNFSASPAIAERIGASDNYFFIKRQLLFLPIAIATMLFLSFQSPRMIRRIALVLFLSKDLYLSTSSLLSSIQYLVLIISLIMIAFTKNAQGLHDKVAKTEVVQADTVKEDVLCTSEN